MSRKTKLVLMVYHPEKGYSLKERIGFRELQALLRVGGWIDFAEVGV